MDLLLRRNQAFSYEDNVDPLIDRSITRATFQGTAIGTNAFRGCTQLESVNAPNATSIGTNAFNGCVSLQSINLPSVASIGANAFESCSNVSEFVNITDSTFPLISEFPGTGFKGCTQIQTVHTSKPINSYTFQNCTALKTVVLNQDGTKVAFFQNCTNLTHLDCGSRFRYLGVNTVAGCANLSTIVLRNASRRVELAGAFLTGTPFVSGGTGGTIYIPKIFYDQLGTGTNDYRAAGNWSTYDGYGTITWAQIEGSEYEHYYVDGTPIST